MDERSLGGGKEVRAVNGVFCDTTQNMKQTNQINLIMWAAWKAKLEKMWHGR